MDAAAPLFPADPRLTPSDDLFGQDGHAGLFDAVKAGALDLPHRVVMAPLTRSRAGTERLPNAMMADYYAQRADAAMIVTEATIISEQGAGYAFTPGIYSSEQVAGWKTIVDRVHEKGGRIICQLWHCGRISHPSMQPDGGMPVAPSAVAPGESAGQAFTETGWQPFPTPRALSIDEIKAIQADYVAAAENAKAAGFDGVEIHSANGYLLDQFLCDGVNHRDDAYGGSVENRARFLMEVVDAISTVWPHDRIGVRLSPWGAFLDCNDKDPAQTHSYVMMELDKLGLAYLSVVEMEWLADAMPEKAASVPPSITAYARQYFTGTILSAGGYGAATASAMVRAGAADMVAFGKLYIANPDLATRFRTGAALNTPDPNSFYGGDASGYTDYPFLEE